MYMEREKGKEEEIRRKQIWQILEIPVTSKALCMTMTPGIL